jgi:hypothetical protein
MKKNKHGDSEYATINGLGSIVIATENNRMTLNQSINAKSHQSGLPTRYSRFIKKDNSFVVEHLRCFIPLCNVKRQEYKDSPNRSGFKQPNCF